MGECCQNPYIFLNLNAAGSTKLIVQTHEEESGGSVNEHPAWQMLNDKCRLLHEGDCPLRAARGPCPHSEFQGLSPKNGVHIRH